MNRLTEAKYFNLSDATKNDRYNEKIWDTANNKSGYDLNGNIQFLTRTGKTGASGLGITTYGQMDNLAYTYNGNQLLKVADTGNTANGFIDGTNAGNDYAYDTNGNMNGDNNKDIASITYNHLNLPDQVIKKDGKYIQYIYDATGRKLSQWVFDASDLLTKASDYAGEFFYENDTLKFINHEEGRVVMTGSQPEYQYHLKDHLGNVRVTFTSTPDTQQDVATMEAANQVSEKTKFLRYDNQRLVNNILFDHTNDGAGITGNAIRLSGSANEKTRLEKSISVMPGDVIQMEVYAKYIDTNHANLTTALNTLITQIAAGTAPAGTVIDGSNYNTNSANPFSFTGLNGTAGSTGTGPKAYLNYLVYDKDFNVILAQSGYQRLSATPKEDGQNVAHEKLSASITIAQAGYVYIYLSNEETTNPVEVYFDDFKVTQTKSPVIASNDYYPFGLTFNSYERENIVREDIKYNGKEIQDELSLGWLDYGARMYMPEIGRWGVSDPKAESYEVISPYSYAFDNPIRFIDLQGKDPGDVVVVFDGADLSSLIPPGNGQKLVSQLNMNGGSGRAFVGQFWETHLVDNPGGEYYSFRRLEMNSTYDMNVATQAAYNYIKENRKKGGRVVIYGYSWGGVLANHLAKRLQEDKIDVDYLIFVDAANGDKSDEVDRSVSENVKQVDNYYNPDPNSNVLKSHGLPASAKNESKTKVKNTVKITWNDGGKKTKVIHSNIDEATFDDVLKQINEFLNKK